jgi:photosystem II stability/assembly factor-like uncharacterized protein
VKINVCNRNSFRVCCRFLVLIVIALGVSPLAAQAFQKWVVVKRIFPHGRSAGPLVSVKAPILEAVTFIDSTNGWAAGDNIILRTTNGGRRWEEITLTFPVNLRDIFFQNKFRGWAVGDSQGRGIVLSTDDGGINWRTQSKIEFFSLSGIHGVWFVDENRGWAVGEVQQNGSVNGVILATENGGQDWRLQYSCAGICTSLNAIKFTDLNRGWAVGGNLILHTEDGGKLWIAQPAQGSDLFDVDFVSVTEGWVAGGKGLLLHTRDGGKQWHKRQLPAKYRALWLSSVRFVDALNGWVAGDNGAVFSTHDGGVSWGLETFGSSPFLRELAVTSRAVFAVGNNGLILRRASSFPVRTAEHRTAEYRALAFKFKRKNHQHCKQPQD